MKLTEEGETGTSERAIERENKQRIHWLILFVYLSDTSVKACGDGGIKKGIELKLRDKKVTRFYFILIDLIVCLFCLFFFRLVCNYRIISLLEIQRGCRT